MQIEIAKNEVEQPQARVNSLFSLISKKAEPALPEPHKNAPAPGPDKSLTTDPNSKQPALSQKKTKKPLRWSEQDSRTFFKCLELFGMDFSMIKEVLSHKTQRQILRKFHKEKKRNPDLIEHALKIHESSPQDSDKRCNNFLDKVFRQTHGSELLSDTLSDDSLDKAVNKKLKLMIQNSKDYEDNYEDEVIKPLNEYFK